MKTSCARVVTSGAAVFCVACGAGHARPALLASATAREPLNSSDVEMIPTPIRCRAIVGATLWDSSAATSLRTISHGDSSGAFNRALKVERTLPDLMTFEALETRACPLINHGISTDEYVAFIDSVVPVVLAAHADIALQASAPTLIAPQSGSRYDNFPRETTVSWHSVPNTDHYLLEVQSLVRRYRVERSGAMVDLGSHWTPHNDGLHSAVVNDTVAIFYFIGAQLGRWRVRAISSDGKSTPPSDWRTFLYLR